MAKGNKSIRASQLITPFGVGAVVELGGESFVCMDVAEWPAGSCVKLAENTLEHVLRKELRRPPTEAQDAAVPFGRFPRWLFCPSCRRLHNYKLVLDQANDFESPKCRNTECKSSDLVPMRFVAVCEHGHLQDVDWHWWAHKSAQVAQSGQCSRMTSQLYFHTTGASGGDFNAMSIKCSCGATSSFEGLTDRPYPLGCHGRQPWQGRNAETECKAKLKVHPRAASNVYYAQSLSALDIGSGVIGQVFGREHGLRAWLDESPNIGAARQAARLLKEWRTMPDLYKHIIDEACRQFELPADVVETAVLEAIGGKPSPVVTASHDRDDSQFGILRAEWPFLARSTGIQSEHLVTRPVKPADWPTNFAQLVDQITLVVKLREVRALLGFKRLKPDATLVPVDLGQGVPWLPGVDLFGEGIFLRFSEACVADWEAKVQQKLKARCKALAGKCERWGRDPADQYASPRFIALHTLSHGLIRRLAFDAGYSSSSLRERVYSSNGTATMAGILVYTSAGDSEGSLGGLVRQGEPPRLLQTIQRAIRDLSWCSADPVCSELELQGIDGLNAAACHACSLVSETSCVFNNSLLDRRLLFGGIDGVPGLLDGIH